MKKKLTKTTLDGNTINDAMIRIIMNNCEGQISGYISTGI